ncbi:hypothetical protein ACWGI8_44075, partial [Streptomyces sp. NPDC054841]
MDVVDRRITKTRKEASWPELDLSSEEVREEVRAFKARLNVLYGPDTLRARAMALPRKPYVETLERTVEGFTEHYTITLSAVERSAMTPRQRHDEMTLKFNSLGGANSSGGQSKDVGVAGGSGGLLNFGNRSWQLRLRAGLNAFRKRTRASETSIQGLRFSGLRYVGSSVSFGQDFTYHVDVVATRTPVRTHRGVQFSPKRVVAALRELMRPLPAKQIARGHDSFEGSLLVHVPEPLTRTPAAEADVRMHGKVVRMSKAPGAAVPGLVQSLPADVLSTLDMMRPDDVVVDVPGSQPLAFRLRNLLTRVGMPHDEATKLANSLTADDQLRAALNREGFIDDIERRAGIFQNSDFTVIVEGFPYNSAQDGDPLELIGNDVAESAIGVSTSESVTSGGALTFAATVVSSIGNATQYGFSLGSSRTDTDVRGIAVGPGRAVLARQKYQPRVSDAAWRLSVTVTDQFAFGKGTP